MSDTGDGVPYEHFDTSSQPVERRLEAWREAIGVLFEVQPAEAAAAETPIVLDTWMLGSAVLSAGSGPGFSYARPSRAIAGDGRDLFMFQFYDVGQCHIEHGAHSVTSEAGDLVVTDLARPLTSRETAFRNINLLLPRSSIAPLLRDPDAHGGRVLRRDLPLVALARCHLQELVRHAPYLSRSQAAAVVDATARLIAATLNGTVDGELVDGVQVALACRIRRFIEDHLHGHDLTPKALAARFGLSRATLYRLFSMEGGVREYVQRRRLKRAHAHLTSPAYHSMTIAMIGREAGYTHAQDFVRAYRREFDVCPSEDRDHARASRRARLMRRAPTLPLWSEWVHRIR